MSPLLAVAMTLSGSIGGMHNAQPSMPSGFTNGYPAQMMQMPQTPTNSFSSLFGSPMPNEAQFSPNGTLPDAHSSAQNRSYPQMQQYGMPTSFPTQPLQQLPQMMQYPQSLGPIGSQAMPQGLFTQNFTPQTGPGIQNIQLPNTYPQYPQQVQTSSNVPIPPSMPTNVSNTGPTGDLASQIETDVLADTNAQREQNGLPDLTENTVLATAANSHSADMLANNYFSHTDQNGCDPSCRVTNAGYNWQSVGENIHMMSGYNLDAAGTAQKIVSDWMNSPEHRANMLNSSYQDIGVGVAVNGSTIYTTADFGKAR